MYAGPFTAEHKLSLLVDVVERLGPPYALLAVGAGAVPPRPHARVRVLPCEVCDPLRARWLAGADVFVQAGDRPTSGAAVLEAMACGTPAVVRAQAGLAELVDGSTGIAVDSDAVGPWAEAIAAVFSEGRERRAAAALARAQGYRWGRVLPTLLAQYEGVLGVVLARQLGATLPSVAWLEAG